MSKLGITLLALVTLSTSSYGTVTYQGHDADTRGKLDFHKFSKYKRQSSVTPNTTIMDDHLYYTSVFYGPGPSADNLWVDLSGLVDREDINLTDPVLSSNYRYFATHPLPFNFPYYGHIINSIAVTTGGFLYASNFFHPEIIFTHNIAPLQADFNPTLNDTARIFVYSTDDRFTVQWDQMHNHDHVDAGPFTFQVSLFRDGTIHFVYKEVPLLVSEIDNGEHPVEVGLSDALYIDETLPGDVVFRTVFEYHRVQLNASDLLNYSAYVITPVLNCVVASSCEECTNLTRDSAFSCEWCPTLERCSDGIDRYTQEWLENGCDDTAVPTLYIGTTPPAPIHTGTTPPAPIHTGTTPPAPIHTGTTPPAPVHIVATPPAPLSAGAVAGISLAGILVLAVVILVIGGAVILFIGYKRPTSKLGLFMIEHRPKAMSLNKTSATYNVESGRTELKQDLSQ